MCLFDNLLDVAAMRNAKRKTYEVVKPRFFEYVKSLEAAGFKARHSFEVVQGHGLTKCQKAFFKDVCDLHWETYGSQRLTWF